MSEHATHEMHQHSLKAHTEEREAGHFSQRERLILVVLGQQKLTDREILELTPFTDMNAIRPRVTEMIKAGILVECGSKLDPTTGKHVRIVNRASNQQQSAFSW